MVHLLNARTHSSPQPVPPERRRVIVVGASATGMAAAFHLAEHSLLLEARQNLEATDDQPHNLTLGAARARAVGAQGPRAEGQGSKLSVAEREACSASNATASAQPLIHVARWVPPIFGPDSADDAHDEEDERAEPLSLRALALLLRGELRLGATVVRISPAQRLVELADGARFVYDKLLSTVA